MQWVKTHLMIVIVGSISVLSLTGLVLGYVLSTVGQELEADSQVLSSLQAIRPVNEAVIEAARKQQQAEAQKLHDVLESYKNAKQYEPIESGVFSETDHMQKTGAAYRFQSAYSAKLRDLLVKLRATDVPTAAEFDRHVKNAIAEKEKKQKEIMAGLSEGPAMTPGGPAAPRLGPGGGFGRPGGAPAYGVLSAADEETRLLRMGLALSRARSILCYADVFNLDDRSELIGEGLRSGKRIDDVMEDIWYAQMALWIQQDVLGGLARLNDKVAEGFSERDRWVANMPFKRLLSFEMGNYVAPATAGGAADMMAMRPGAGTSTTDLLTAGPTATFTQRGSTPSVDVVRFRMRMVVDARSILHVLDAISKAGFYTPVKMDIGEVDLQLQTNEYYIYGSAPIVDMTVVYEGCFLRSSYEKWMPEAIKLAVAEGRALGIGKSTGGSPAMPDMRRGPTMPTPRLRGGGGPSMEDDPGVPRRRM